MYLRKLFSWFRPRKNEPERRKSEVRQKPKLTLEEKRKKTKLQNLGELEKTYRRIKAAPFTYIDESALIVNFQKLTLDGNSMPYFRPLPLKDLESHPVILDDEHKQFFLSTYNEIMADIDNDKAKDPTDGAVALGQDLSHHFASLDREGPRATPLDDISNWAVG